MPRVINYVKHKATRVALGLMALAFPGAIFLTSGASLAVTNTYTVSPWTYGPANCPGEVAQWDNSIGNPAPSLHLTKPCPTPTDAATGATVNNVNGITLNSLGFDYLTAGHCGAGAPRYNVYTTSGVYYFFGCTYGIHTDQLNGWTRVVFHDADAQPSDGVTPWPGFGSVTITGIDVVMDEGNDVSATQGSPGDSHLDNFAINGQTVSDVNTPTNKDQCKNGGYVNYTDEFGNQFTNQGQCVAFVASGSKSSYHINNRNKINVVNTNSQTATTGNARVSHNTTGGNATSGNASNSNSNTNTVNVSNNPTF